MNFINNIFTTSEGAKFLISVAAGVICAFTPDYIDMVIEMALPTIFGIDVYKVSRK